MATAMARDLRTELQSLMSCQMDFMFSKLESQLLKALSEGGSLPPGGDKLPAVSPTIGERGLPPMTELQPTNGSTITPGPAHSILMKGHALDPVGRLKANKASTYCPIRPAWKTSVALTPSDTDGHGSYQLVDSGEGAEGVAPSTPMHKDVSDAMRRNVHLTHRGLVFTRVLNMLTCFMLVCSAGADAFEVDFQARQSTDKLPVWFNYLELGLLGWWTFELLARVSLKGSVFFYTNLKWNYFQVLLVLGQMAEETIDIREELFDLAYVGPDWPRQVLQLLGLMRIMRVLHVLDHMDLASELHLLMTSIGGSFRSLCWALVFICIPTFVFAMILTHTVSEFRQGLTDDSVSIDALMKFYGTLDRSMLALFWSISGGLSWNEAMRPLSYHGFDVLALGFFLYISLTVFSVMNILTGVFVNSATTAVSNESDKKMIKALWSFFEDADKDGSGHLTAVEFQKALSNSDTLKDCLQSLDIGADHALSLFNLLDVDGSGEIEINEFVQGCIKFRGTVKAIDFATFIVDWNSLKGKLEDHITALPPPRGW